MFKYLVATTIKNRNIMNSCNYKFSSHGKQLPYQCFVKLREYQELLMDNLGLERSEASKLLLNKQELFRMSARQLIKQCRLCMKLHVGPRGLVNHADFLTWSAQTLENRILMLEEMGVTSVQADLISNIEISLRIRMQLFKAYLGIPKEMVVAESFLNCVGKPPPSVEPLKIPSDQLSVRRYRRHCWEWYIHWRLGIPWQEKAQLKQIAAMLCSRSFRVVDGMFNILHNEVGLTVEEIQRHRCLRNGSPRDLRRIFNEIRTIGGTDFQTLIKSLPILHRMEYENVKEVIQLVKKHGQSEEQIRRSPQILIIPSHKVAEKLKQLDNIPELRVLKNNPNALRLVYRFDEVRIRLSYLHHLNIKNITFYILTSKKNRFREFVQTGHDATKAKAIGSLLEKVLILEKKEILRRLKKHPFWRHVDLVSIYETYNFLSERFTTKDLEDNIQLLLYPRELVRKVLDDISKSNEVLKEGDEGYSGKYMMAMCLYEIEKDFNFTGDGIWRNETSPSHTSDPHKCIDDELSDVEIAELEDIDLQDSRGCE